jgi:hypothetical protein
MSFIESEIHISLNRSHGKQDLRRCIRLYSITQVGDIMEFTFNSNMPSLDNFLLDQFPCNEIRSMISLCFHHRSFDNDRNSITFGMFFSLKMQLSIFLALSELLKYDECLHPLNRVHACD